MFFGARSDRWIMLFVALLILGLFLGGCTFDRRYNPGGPLDNPAGTGLMRSLGVTVYPPPEVYPHPVPQYEIVVPHEHHHHHEHWRDHERRRHEHRWREERRQEQLRRNEERLREELRKEERRKERLRRDNKKRGGSKTHEEHPEKEDVADDKPRRRR